jgi:hypothetical protein
MQEMVAADCPIQYRQKDWEAYFAGAGACLSWMRRPLVKLLQADLQP